MLSRITFCYFRWTLALGDDARAALGRPFSDRASRPPTWPARDVRHSTARRGAKMTGKVIRARQGLSAANEDDGTHGARAAASIRRKY